MHRREFLSLPTLALLPLLPIALDRPPLRVHYRFEHSDGVSYTEGNGSFKTFTEVAKRHEGYDLVFLKPARWQ